MTWQFEMEAMKHKRYKGRLYYDAIEYLDVESFIVRDDEVAFLLASVTAEHGRWQAESGKPAKLQANGDYLAAGVGASKSGTPAADPWDIRFRIGAVDADGYLEVSGELTEAGRTFAFEGELEACTG